MKKLKIQLTHNDFTLERNPDLNPVIGVIEADLENFEVQEIWSGETRVRVLANREEDYVRIRSWTAPYYFTPKSMSYRDAVANALNEVTIILRTDIVATEKV